MNLVDIDCRSGPQLVGLAVYPNDCPASAGLLFVARLAHIPGAGLQILRTTTGCGSVTCGDWGSPPSNMHVLQNILVVSQDETRRLWPSRSASPDAEATLDGRPPPLGSTPPCS
jgi:hypothetical protein